MILSGKTIAEKIQAELKERISREAKPPGLAVILIGENPSSHAYVNMKRKACQSVGIDSFYHHLPETISERELLQLIDQLNHEDHIHGVLVQMPLPPHIKKEKIFEAISPQKDIDGFHPENMGKLLLGHPSGFVPCTPLGIKVLLEKSKIEIEGKDVVIVGRSAIVGKPLAALLMQPGPGTNATVTIVHSRTKDLEAHTRRADILIAAIGSPSFIKAKMVKEGAVVVDVGINRLEDLSAPNGYKLVGDVDFFNVEKKCYAITPVPKGVGPMTVAMLLQNTWLSFQRKGRDRLLQSM